MIKETNPTEEYLKAVTGKFDLETVFFLELSKKNINRLSAIPNCTSLVLLNLSKNNLSSVSGLSNLKQLNYLDLSFNKISSVDELGQLLFLRHLKLHGNNISSFPSALSTLKRLEKLTFQIMPYKDDKDTNTTNPFCTSDTYRKDMLDLLPNLRMLDGISRDMQPFTVDNEINLKELEEKLDEKNFNFDFGDKIKFNIEDVISQSDIKFAQKKINEKYAEFESNLEEIKKFIKEIK